MAKSSAAGFAAAVIAVGTLAASATTYKAVSGVSAQTGPWSYFGRLDGGAPTPLTTDQCGGTTGITCVGNGQASPNHIGVISNVTGGTVSTGPSQVAADSLSLDPESGAAIARWTAPASGTYDISGSFTDESTQGSPGYISIINSQSAIPLLATTLLAGYRTATSFNFNDVRFTIGDFVDFVASVASPSQPLDIGLDAPITNVSGNMPGARALDANSPTAVPEPGSLLLLGSAALGLGLVRRCRYGL